MTAGWLDRAQTVAGAGYDRWLVPPCAVAIQLCIGMAPAAREVARLICTVR